MKSLFRILTDNKIQIKEKDWNLSVNLGTSLYIYSFQMMVIGGKLGDDGEMLTFTVLIGRGESVSKARRDNSTTKGLQSH